MYIVPSITLRICPGLILGPQVAKTVTVSNSIILSILNGDYPGKRNCLHFLLIAGVPHLFFHTVDVRDVARAHIAAMDSPIMQVSNFIESSNVIGKIYSN